MTELLINALAVFGMTLILTKAKILAGKREFVQERYLAAKADGQKPGWIHRIWRAWWTCPMCSGFWVGLVVCFFFPSYGLIIDVMVVFGINWLMHCLENLLFFSGEVMEQVSDIPWDEYKDKSQQLFSLIDRYFRKKK